MDELLASPVWRTTERAIDDGYERFVSDIITLTEVPAPPFCEGAKAEAFRTLLAETGLKDIRIDEIGNVIGLRPGRGKGSGEADIVVVAAHLDTVFPAGTDVTVRREGNRLFAPGIGDDTRGLAALLAYLRAIDLADIATERDLLFVANVGEEGPGDLRGMRHLFEKGIFAGRIGAMFTLDCASMEDVVTGAIGSKRYRISFHGPGGHSFLNFGIVNPSNALGGFMGAIAEVDVPSEPRTTFSCSVVGGCTSVNAIPQEVWVEVDLRSADPIVLGRLDEEMRGLVARAVDLENTRNVTSAGQLTADISLIGDRPAAALTSGGLVVDETLAALRAFGITPRIASSSTDANIPLSLGIPAIAIGSGHAAGGFHTLQEWIDVDPGQSKRALAAGLAAVLAVAKVA